MKGGKEQETKGGIRRTVPGPSLGAGLRRFKGKRTVPEGGTEKTGNIAGRKWGKIRAI